jgi:short-subunit dehydrogenase
MEPKGNVVLVTGASSGIGLACAHALAKEGARVVLAARTESALEQTAAAIRAAGGEALAVRMDVTNDASVAAAVATALDRLGRIDALVNNAGNGGALGFWADAPASATREMFDVHLFGAERVTRAVLPSMVARGAGTIVNFASTVGWVPMPAAAAYCAAKAAVLAFSESLRHELAPSGVEVIVFAPPHTRTAAGDAWPLGVQTFAPEWVAREFVQALRRGRPRFLAGASNRALLAMQRISPALASSIMRGVGLRAAAKAAGMRELPPATSRPHTDQNE